MMQRMESFSVELMVTSYRPNQPGRLLGMRELPELFALVYDDANSNNVAYVRRFTRRRHSLFIDDTFRAGAGTLPPDLLVSVWKRRSPAPRRFFERLCRVN
jgi:hypothetical protein